MDAPKLTALALAASSCVAVVVYGAPETAQRVKLGAMCQADQVSTTRSGPAEFLSVVAMVDASALYGDGTARRLFCGQPGMGGVAIAGQPGSLSHPAPDAPSNLTLAAPDRSDLKSS